jgi:type II secretory pathway pseudopilin PulG
MNKKSQGGTSPHLILRCGGQSLIEILIGLGVISILIASASYGLATVLRISTIAEQNQIGGTVSNSLLESSSLLAMADWNSIYNLQKGYLNHYYLVNSPTTTPTIVSGDEGVISENITYGLVGHWGFDESGGLSAYDNSGTGNLGTLTNIPALDSDLEGYWKLDETSGNTATDSSVNSNVGTMLNSPTKLTGENCKFGGCLSFDGVDDYVTTNYTTSSPMTLSFWFKKQTQTNAGAVVFGGRTPGCWTSALYINGDFELRYYNAGPETSIINPLLNDTWYNVAVVVSGGSTDFYVNGSYSSTYAGSLSNGLLNQFGATCAGAGPFKGTIDDIRVYERALTASEISRLYQLDSCKIGSCLTFDGDDNYTLIDTSDYKFNSSEDSFTASVWINPTVLDGTYDGIISTDGVGDVAWKIVRDIGQDYFKARYGNKTISYPAVSVGEWHHYSFTKSGTTLTLYLDGVLTTSDTCPSSYSGGSDQMVFGSYRVSDALIGNHIFNGSLDDVRIYNRALSASEISQLYNSPIFTRYFYPDTVKRDNCGRGDITTDSESTCLGTAGVGEDPSTQKITIKTLWNMKGARQTLEDLIYVTRWINDATKQTSWDGSSGTAGPLTAFSSGFFDYTAISTTTTGAIKVDLSTASSEYAMAPSSINLTVGSTTPVGGVVNVVIPAVGGTDTTGTIIGWAPSISDTIKFVVTDSGDASSTITINESSYTSGADYAVSLTAPLTIIVTTIEAGKDTAVRTFTVTVASCGVSETEGLVSYWKFDETTGSTADDYYGSNDGTLTNIPALSSDPDGHWKLDETSGTTATDSSVNTNDGTLANSPTRLTGGDCKLDGCLSFNGTNNYVNIPMNLPETNYTYGLWIKTTRADQSISSVRQPLPTGGANDRNLYIDASGNIKHRIWNASEIITTSGVNVVDGNWHYIVVLVETGVGQKIYIDGVERASGTADHSDFDWEEGLVLGYDAASTNDYFLGSIDDIRIYNSVLTVPEISRLYQLDSCKVGNCLTFDGTDDYVSVPDSASFDITNAITIATWIKPTELTAYAGIWDKYYGGSYNGMQLLVYTGGAWEINANATWHYLQAGGLQDGVWSHIVMTYDSSVPVMKLYLDGSEVASKDGAINFDFGDSQSLWIGRRTAGGSYYFNGIIDEFAIYDEALTPDEIETLYNRSNAETYYCE